VSANYTNFTLNESVGALQEIGFFNYVLPMGIFFLILYGILDQFGIISKDKKVNALVSLLISAFIMLYAYVNSLEVFFMEFYAKMSVAIIILLFAFTMAVFAFKALKNNGMIKEGHDKVWNAVLIIMSALIVSTAFEEAPGQIGAWAADTSGIVLALAFLGAIISGFIKGGGGEK
jgi:hypothetical protein